MDNKTKPQDNVPQVKSVEEPKQKCNKCGGRTALISGIWYYSPDQEPYENGVIEPTERNESEAYMNGFICDDCDTIQDVFVDEENYKSRIAELEASNAKMKIAGQKLLGLILNIKYETDHLPDSYYEWMDRLINETDEMFDDEDISKLYQQALNIKEVPDE